MTSTRSSVPWSWAMALVALQFTWTSAAQMNEVCFCSEATRGSTGRSIWLRT
ncbi:MAG: hypothetical protein R2746_03890 [Acidimicrobiales bacterium]